MQTSIGTVHSLQGGEAVRWQSISQLKWGLCRKPSDSQQAWEIVICWRTANTSRNNISCKPTGRSRIFQVFSLLEFCIIVKHCAWWTKTSIWLSFLEDWCTCHSFFRNFLPVAKPGSKLKCLFRKGWHQVMIRCLAVHSLEKQWNTCFQCYSCP